MADTGRVSGSHVQVNHGFSRLVAVRFDGSNWVRAAAGDSGVGIVGSVFDSNTFEFIQLGELDGLSGLTPGSLYYIGAAGVLSTTVNGAAIFQAYTVTRGFVLGAASGASTSGSDAATAALRAQLHTDEVEIASLAGRLSALEGVVPSTGTPLSETVGDGRYQRTDAWIVNVDPGGDFGEVLVNTDTLSPVYNSEAPVMPTVPSPLVLAPFGSVGLDNTVNCAVLAGTLLYVGGGFGTVTDAAGSHTRHCAACLDLSTGLWTAWNPNVTSGGGTSVAGIALVPGGTTAFIAGLFGAVGGTSRTNIAQVDLATGALQSWTAGSTLNAQATGVALSATLVYVSGQFTTAGGSTRNYFAAFGITSGTLSAWDAGANSPAFGTNPYGLTPIVDGLGGVVLAGGFVSIHGVDRFYSARVDALTGVLDTAWLSPLAFDSSGSTEASILATWRGEYLVGKAIGFPGTNIVVRSTVAVGGADGGFATRVDDGGSVFASAYDPDDSSSSPIYVGGSFSTINGSARTYLAAISPVSGSALAGFAPALTGAVNALAFVGGRLIAAGAFTAIGSQTRNRLAVIDLATGKAV